MKYIDEAKIYEVLERAKAAGPAEVDAALVKSRMLKRLTLAETAVLITAEDQDSLKKIFEAAAYVKDRIYGSRVVLFAPLYISNRCANSCLYCAFKADNAQIERRTLTQDEVKEEVLWLLSRGHKRVLLVSGEGSVGQDKAIDHYVKTLDAIYSVSYGAHRIRRVNINCAPLSVDEFRLLKKAGIGTYQIFQETYHEATYRRVHPSGPKSDPDNRISSVDRAFCAGIDDVGIGVLFGLYDYRFEVLGLLSHVEALEKKFGIGPHTISVPRLEPAVGVDFDPGSSFEVSGSAFKKIVAVLRLAVPYTGLILSTRETAAMRDELFGLGVSQVSAGSTTSPGGYSVSKGPVGKDAQFVLSDERPLDEVMGSLIERGFIPSFCAACYRKERTGEAFMMLSRPGTIKGKCQMNALITLKEYLDDFAPQALRERGYRLLDRMEKDLDPESRKQLENFFQHIAQGRRDEYV